MLDLWGQVCQAGQGLRISPSCLLAAKSLPSAEEVKKLTWLFGCPLLLGDVAQKSWLHPDSNDLLLEVGPRRVSQPRVNAFHVLRQNSLPDALPTPSTPIPLLPSPVTLGRFVFPSLHPTPCLEGHAHAFPIWKDVFERLSQLPGMFWK